MTKTTITLPFSPEELLAERAKSADHEAAFIEWFAKNYSGEVVFSDPAWHAKRIWRRAKAASAHPQAASSVQISQDAKWVLNPALERMARLDDELGEQP